jgi:phage baseplate assembly protein W
MANLTVNFPLEKTGRNTGFDMISSEHLKELVKFNIKNTLLTCPGERTFDNEDYGACLRKILFEFPTDSVLNTAQTKIREQLEIFVPYIVIEDITITNPESMVAHVRLLYYINEIEARDELLIRVQV